MPSGGWEHHRGAPAIATPASAGRQNRGDRSRSRVSIVPIAKGFQPRREFVRRICHSDPRAGQGGLELCFRGLPMAGANQIRGFDEDRCGLLTQPQSWQI